MLRVILNNIFKKPATRLYPFEKRKAFQHARGHLVPNLDECVFCGLCQKKCPANCLSVNRQEKTWTLNAFSCIVCGLCVEACPKKCIVMDPNHRSPSYTIDSISN